MRLQHVEVRVGESQLGEIVLEDRQTARATRVVNRPRKAHGSCGDERVKAGGTQRTTLEAQQVKSGDAVR